MTELGEKLKYTRNLITHWSRAHNHYAPRCSGQTIILPPPPLSPKVVPGEGEGKGLVLERILPSFSSHYTIKPWRKEYCICTVYCILYTAYCTLYTAYCTYTVHCILYIYCIPTVYCILNTVRVQCVLYSVYCILHMYVCTEYGILNTAC